jgi:hypothetical protein
MARDLEKRTVEWGVWYHENKNRIPRMDFERRLAFYEKTIDGLIELLAIAAEDIRTLEGRKRSNTLYMPNGVAVTGDIRKFG